MLTALVLSTKLVILETNLKWIVLYPHNPERVSKRKLNPIQHPSASTDIQGLMQKVHPKT
jgi:hypothetical protein